LAELEPEARVEPSPAVAPPPGNPRFPQIDSVRAIAVLSVLVYHVAAVTGDLNTRVIGDLIAVGGTQALSVLFLTSGFLLYRPFVRARLRGRPVPSIRRYVRRRMLRILPAYWVALTVLAIFPGVVGVFTGDWWRYYFFLQLYSTRTLNTGIPVAWTLCVEMMFYLLLPVWVVLVRRVRVGAGVQGQLRGELAALGSVALLGVIIQVLASRLIVSQIVADSLLGNCAWIALGMTLAVLSVARTEGQASLGWLRALGARPGLSLLAAAACWSAATAIVRPGGLLGILLSLQKRQPYPRTLADIVLTAGVCVFLVAPVIFDETSSRGPVRRVLGWRPLMWVGLVSYGVYLWHLAVVSLLGESSDPAHFSASGLGLATKISFAPTPVLLVLTLAITLVIAGISYRFVELPFLQLKER
jgi:peptidoglycan/LPS O-acetylase OafA/YrhL